MFKYYIPELNLRDIRNKNIIDKFENKFNKEIINNKIILSIDGFYKLEDNSLIQYKFIEKQHNHITNYIDNYTLIGMDCYEKKIQECFSLPYENIAIEITKIKFNIGDSQNYTVFEKKNDKIIDVYFLSKKKIHEDDIFFKKDISLFVNLLMSN